MKKLGNEIQNIGLEHEFGELFREMLEDPDIVKLIEENNLTNEDIVKNDSMLVSYIISKEKCVGCKGIEKCTKKSPKTMLRRFFCAKVSYTKVVRMNYLL